MDAGESQGTVGHWGLVHQPMVRERCHRQVEGRLAMTSLTLNSARQRSGARQKRCGTASARYATTGRPSEGGRKMAGVKRTERGGGERGRREGTERGGRSEGGRGKTGVGAGATNQACQSNRCRGSRRKPCAPGQVETGATGPACSSQDSAQAKFPQHVTLFDCAASFPQALRLLGHCDISIVLWSGFDSTCAHPCCMSCRDDGTVMVRCHC